MTKNIQENIYKLIKNTASESNIENIFIIGKGPSIDDLEGFRFPKGIIININDSEKIIQGNIGIFSANWVRHSLKDRGFKCEFYLAGKPLPHDVAHELLPPAPLEYDDDDLTIFRLEQEEFYDEPFVLLNALKTCVVIAGFQKTKPNVYLLGFDFSTDKGEVSRKLGVDYAKSEDISRSLMVHSQENDYLQFVKYFQDKPLISLYHVGVKEYSHLTSLQFKEKFGPRIEFASEAAASAGDQTDRVLIVAELTNNHLGDVARLAEMVERAKEAGADLVKIQKRDVDSFYSAEKLSSYYWSPFGKTLRDYRKGVELDEKKLRILDETCRSLGIGWFCSVLDLPSFEAINSFSPALIKIPSTISNHRDFHELVASRYHGPIVISTGYTDQSYEDYVLKTFKNNSRIYLLHCISSYPTAMTDCNIAVVQHYSELAKNHPFIVPGYSSHDLGSFGSLLAVASGARMLEKHVKLGDVDWVHFDKVALDLKTDSFRNYVKDIRDAEIALGSPHKKVLASEHHKYEVVNTRT
jgi:sialic acid synthase SpsE